MPDQQLFNDAQRRSVTITLRILEQSLDEIALLLGQGRAEGGTLYHLRNNMSSGDLERFHRQAQIIREQIATLAGQLGLAADERSVAATAAAKLNYCWEVLQEIDSRGLRAYGQVAAELAPFLDPAVQSLSDKVMELLHLFERQPKK